MHSWQSNGYKANKTSWGRLYGDKTASSRQHNILLLQWSWRQQQELTTTKGQDVLCIFRSFLTTKRYLLEILHYKLLSKKYFAKLCNFRVCSFVFYQVAIRMPVHWDRNNEQLSVLSSLLTSIIMQFWLWSPSGQRGFQYGPGTRKSCHAGGIQSGTSDPFTALSSSGWQF